jgi:hypothetical protein
MVRVGLAESKNKPIFLRSLYEESSKYEEGATAEAFAD